MSAGTATAMRVKLPDGRVVGMDTVEYRDFVRAEVGTWPPFSAEQKAKLYVLLAPMRDRLRERAEARLSAQEKAAAAKPTRRKAVQAMPGVP